MAELRNSIGVTANSAGNIPADESCNVEEASRTNRSIERCGNKHHFDENYLAIEPELSGVVIKLAPFISEIVFKGEQKRLRLIGNQFILESFHNSPNLFSVETTKCEWSDKLTQDEWKKMSAKAKQMIANGNPKKLPDQENPRNYSDSSHTYARIKFPNAQIRFWKRNEESFTFEMIYGYRACCRGTSEKSDMEMLRTAFQNIYSSIRNNGSILDIREQNEIIDPQEDYMTGEKDVVKIQIER